MTENTQSNTSIPAAASEAITVSSQPAQTEAASSTTTTHTAPIANTVEQAPAVTPTILGDATPVSAPQDSTATLDTTTATAETAPTDAAKPTAEVDANAAADEGATQKEAEGQSDETATPPSYEPFSLPEGVTLDNEKLGQFTELLGKHQAKQELGQELVNLYVAEMQDTLTRFQKLQMEQWDKQKLSWKESFVNDPEIGGNRQETTVNAAREFISQYGGTPEQQTEIRQLMDSTGLGNHPAIIRLLSKANMAISEGKPLPARAPMKEVKSKIQTLYGSK